MKIWLLLLLTISLIGCSNNTAKTTKARYADIQSSVTEMAKTKLAKSYLFRMPVSGVLERVKYQVGDKISKGSVLVQLDQYPLKLTVADLNGRLSSLAKLFASEQARQQGLIAENKFAQSEFKRNRSLIGQSFVSKSSLQQTGAQAVSASSTVHRQTEVLAAILAYADSIRAQYNQANYTITLSKFHAPVAGIVLQRYQQGGNWLPVGTPVMKVGSFGDLEAVADVLSVDAITLKVGGRVLLSIDGHRFNIKGKIKRIEPEGFTKRSPLGVDEQRVNVVVSFKPPHNFVIGVAYRLFAKFIIAEKKHVIVIPRYSLLQNASGQYFVITKSGSSLKKQNVLVGIIADHKVEITSGISKGQQVITMPTVQILNQLH